MGLVDLDGRDPAETEFVKHLQENEDSFKLFGMGSQGESGRYHDFIYGDYKFFQWNVKGFNATEGSDKKGPYSKRSMGELGVNIIALKGGLFEGGYNDFEGLWQAKYEVEALHAGARLRASTEYIGAKVNISALTLSADVRVVEIGEYRFYIGGTVDLASVGLKYGVSPEDKKAEFGASMGAGAGVSISWENIADIGIKEAESNNNQCP